MEQKLKLCPFCGSRNVATAGVRRGWVKCNTCGGRTGNGDLKTMIAVWNGRHAEVQPKNKRACCCCEWLFGGGSAGGWCAFLPPTHRGLPRVATDDWCSRFQPKAAGEE